MSKSTDSFPRLNYLITGATGDVGSRLVSRLRQQGAFPRVLVRDETKARQLFGDRVTIVTGDLANLADVVRAFENIHSVFLVNTGPEIPARDKIAVEAAKCTGVKHIVKLSSMDVEQGLAIGAWHEQGEAAIQASGVPFTFLRPTGFMSNLLAWSHSIRTESTVGTSTGGGRRAFIHSRDIAEVAATVLTNGSHEGEILTLTGPEALTFSEVAAKIGAVIGKKLTVLSISDEQARGRYSATGASREETEAHVSLWRAIREGRLANVTNTVEQILGRKPISLDSWAVENAAEFC